MKTKTAGAAGAKADTRKTISFRPVDGVSELVSDAERATGTNISELCNEALKDFLPRYVVKKAEEQKKAAEDFVKKHKK